MSLGHGLEIDMSFILKNELKECCSKSSGGYPALPLPDEGDSDPGSDSSEKANVKGARMELMSTFS